jgi:hypothetical protein
VRYLMRCFQISCLAGGLFWNSLEEEDFTTCFGIYVQLDMTVGSSGMTVIHSWCISI